MLCQMTKLESTKTTAYKWVYPKIAFIISGNIVKIKAQSNL